MRVTELAKQIGITSQELRHELALTDFGVKSTDREVPDMIAIGIVRVLSIKYKGRVKKMTPFPKLTEKKVTKPKVESSKKKEEQIKEEKPTEKKTKKQGKVVQTIDSIRFLKPAKEKVIQQEKTSTPYRKKSSKKQTESQKKKETKVIDTITTVESQALLHRKHKAPSPGPLDKNKKRVKITHKLTLDDVAKEDIGSLEEQRIEEALERERLKEQKKIKAKSIVKKISKEEQEQIQIKKKSGIIELPEIISVKEFAEKIGIQVPKIIGSLMKNGIMATINQQIDFDTAALIADELDVKVKKSLQEISSEDVLAGDLANLLQDEPENLTTRPPIVTIMGHVDHGKTKLLDTIRDSNVIAQESGGITQHIGAYQIEYQGQKITFLDTPGHESFTAIRARGAKVTDIAILVVAADEGIKPQTIEAINHAREAKVPIIVAINKIDKPEANVDKIKGELAEHELTPEDWGGKTICVPISALANKNIDQLLEMILLVAEIENLKANSNRPAVGTVIETHLDSSLGPMATVVINTGTLKIMDSIVIGETCGRIKLMRNSRGENQKKAGPAAAVQIAGIDKMPLAGDIIQVVKDDKTAKQKAQALKELKEERLKKGNALIMQEIINKIQSGKLKSLKILLKADTKGSLDAIQQSLAKIKSDKVYPKIIHAGVGGVTESDVMMAAASRGIVLGFNVLANAQVKKTAEKEGLKISLYQIIYELINDVKNLLLGLIEPEIVETILGQAKIQKIFFSKKKKSILGCLVSEGSIHTKTMVRIKRGNEVIVEGKITNLKRVQETVKEVKSGTECGIEFEGKGKPEEGDTLECYKQEEVAGTL